MKRKVEKRSGVTRPSPYEAFDDQVLALILGHGDISLRAIAELITPKPTLDKTDSNYKPAWSIYHDTVRYVRHAYNRLKNRNRLPFTK